MPARSDVITRLPLTEAGLACPKQKMQEKEARLLKDLHDDVPILRRLVASIVTTEYEVIDNSLWLLVLLQEAPQSTLPFPTSQVQYRTYVPDPYMADLNEVCRQIGQVEGRILIAVSGAASPLDGTTDGPQASSTATIRRRIKRGLSNGSVLAPGLPYARSLFLEAAPATLPQGPRVVISALVKALETACAQLISVRLEGALVPGVSVKFAATRQVPMARIGAFQRVEAGTRLQTAMDSHARLRFGVVAALAWESGDVVSFELTRFVDQ